MTTHENHQFMEMNSKKGPGGMMEKEVMCPECGEMRTMHEDGRLEVKKKGKMMHKEEDMKKEME